MDPHACDACLDSTVDVSRSRRRFRLQAQIADLVPSVNHAALPYPQGDRLEAVLRGIIGLDAVCIRDRSRAPHRVADRAVHWLFVAPRRARPGVARGRPRLDSR